MAVNRVPTSLGGNATGTSAAGLDSTGVSNRMADERTLQDVEARLSRIEGQVRGIRNMNSEGRLCVDIVTQVAAVRAALKKVADVMVADHVQQWLGDAASNPGTRGEQDVEELLKVFTTNTTVSRPSTRHRLRTATIPPSSGRDQDPFFPKPNRIRRPQVSKYRNARQREPDLPEFGYPSCSLLPIP